ncbi:MAG: two-component regulator propeller domain-containing protein [Candidatus Latescibacterota bacterium]
MGTWIRRLVVCSALGAAGVRPAWGHSGNVALALPVSGITVDGYLSEWPGDLPQYPVTLAEHGRPPRDAADYLGHFHLGYDAAERALYVAVDVRDESTVLEPLGTAGWDTQDGCEVYLDVLHGREQSPGVQHISYGMQNQAGTGVQPAGEVVYARRDEPGRHQYEWRLDLEARDARPGDVLGFDLVVADKDADGSFSWMAWGPGVSKMHWPDRRGDVILVGQGTRTGELRGTVSTQDPARIMAGVSVEIQSVEHAGQWARVATDGAGAFRLALPEGAYRVQPEVGGGGGGFRLAQVEGDGWLEMALVVPPAAGQRRAAGPGRAVESGGGVLRGNWRSFGVPDGLPGGTVGVALQDRAGALWVGTESGLSRFDGQRFAHFSLADGLAEGTVRALCEDGDGVLWIGTQGGLSRYDGHTFTTFTQADGLVGEELRALQVDPGGQLWIGTAAGLSRFDGRYFTNLTTADGLASNQVICLAQDSSGAMWIGTQGGVSRYAGGILTRLASADPGVSDVVYALLVDHQGALWIGGDKGLGRYRGGTFSVVVPGEGIPGNEVHALLEDHGGNLWIGTSGNGLRFWAAADRQRDDPAALSARTTEDGLAANQVDAIAEDRSGGVWVCGAGGMSRSEATCFAHVGAEEGLVGASVRALAQGARGEVWIGTERGLCRHDGRGLVHLDTRDGLVHAVTTSLAPDGGGGVWVGTENGLSRYDGRAFTTHAMPKGRDWVAALLVDPAGGVWIGHRFAGLSRYDGRRFQHFDTGDGLVHNVISALALDPDGSLWVGTNDGLSRYDGQSFTNYTTADGLANNQVTSLLVDHAGRLWVGTVNGLNRREGGGFATYTTADGLVHNLVAALTEDDRGVLWIGTPGGVSLYDGQVFQSLLRRDGLAGGTVQALLRDRSGEVWIGTQGDGVTRYRPHLDPPPIALTDVVADRRYGPVRAVRLPSSQSLLAFAYQGISLKTRPGAMRYRYRLLGHQAQWRTTASTRVEYQDLPHGSYIFEVQAVDRDLSYSVEPARVEVSIHLPYWTIGTWTALALGVLLVGWQGRQVMQRSRTLRHSEARFRTLVQDHTVPLYRCTPGPRGRYLMVNPAMVRTMGFSSAEEMLQADVADLYQDPQERAGFSEVLVARGHVEGFELRMRRRDGTPIWVAVSARVAHGEGGEVDHFIGMLEDITRRKEIEEALHLAKEAAEEANRAKSRFLANMSHEIRTPMNAIVGFSDLLVGTQLTQVQRDYVKTVQTSSQALLGLLNDILDLSKIEAGRMELVPVPFRLGQVLEEVSALFREKVAQSGVELVVDVADGVPDGLVGDPLRLRQVLVNLLGNALKFTAQGEVAVVVSCPEGGAADRVTLRFGVRDTGIGIPADKLGGLFAAFTQVDASTTRRYGGTGLGLAVSRQLVELMGGTIGVESEEGKGSLFHFTVVLAPSPERAPAPRAPDELPGVAAQPVAAGCLSGVRVLLVEDNPVNQRLAVILLEQAGCAVSVAANGQEALEAVSAQEFDAVLMDLQMPELDGYEATRRMRELGLAVPILAMTASAMSGDRERCLGAGMNDYVSKPIAREELFGTLSRWTTPRGQPSPALPPAAEGTPAALGSLELVAALPGIEVPEALRRLGGDGRELRSLLQDFARQFGTATAGIRQALSQGDAALARRLAHTLKGVAGNLSAKGVEQAARALETALAGGQREELEGLLGQVDGALGPVLASVQALGPPAGETAAPPRAGVWAAVDAQTVGPLLGELQGHLASRDPVAVAQCLERLQAQVAGTPLERAVQKAAAQAQDFDFDAAQRGLAELTDGAGIPLT